jgi:hypothetical protein
MDKLPTWKGEAYLPLTGDSGFALWLDKDNYTWRNFF